MASASRATSRSHALRYGNPLGGCDLFVPFAWVAKAATLLPCLDPYGMPRPHSPHPPSWPLGFIAPPPTPPPCPTPLLRPWQVEELSRITTGICLYNRAIGRGGSALPGAAAQYLPQAGRLLADIGRWGQGPGPGPRVPRLPVTYLPSPCAGGPIGPPPPTPHHPTCPVLVPDHIPGRHAHTHTHTPLPPLGRRCAESAAQLRAINAQLAALPPRPPLPLPAAAAAPPPASSAEAAAAEGGDGADSGDAGADKGKEDTPPAAAEAPAPVPVPDAHAAARSRLQAEAMHRGQALQLFESLQGDLQVWWPGRGASRQRVPTSGGHSLYIAITISCV